LLLGSRNDSLILKVGINWWVDFGCRGRVGYRLEKQNWANEMFQRASRSDELLCCTKMAL